MFGTCNCCGDQTAAVRLWSTRWGFAPFHDGFDTVYTVGTGFSETAMQAGMLCKRVASGIVTGVFEARDSFTASADPETDTANWARAGLTAAPCVITATYTVGSGWSGSVTLGCVAKRVQLGAITGLYECTKTGGSGDPATDTAHWRPYWWNCEPILKYVIAAVFKVGAGWQSATALGFGGNRPDTSFDFEAGALAAREDSGALSFYRCKSAVDRSGDPSQGDPATDTDHWTPYAGRRSLWLDFTQAPIAGYSAPFSDHRLPTKRYSTWRETTQFFDHENNSLGSFVREFQRDNLSGIIALVRDDAATGSFTIDIPDPPAIENPTRPSPPSPPSSPPPQQNLNYLQAVGDSFVEEYNLRRTASVSVPKLKFPDWHEAPIGYYSDAATPIVPGEGGEDYSIYYPPQGVWVNMDQPDAPWVDGWQTFNVPEGHTPFSQTKAFDLVDVTLGETQCVFTWELTVPWYWHCSCTRHYAAFWYGRTLPPATSWVMWFGVTDLSVSAVNITACRVVQTISLLDEITHAAHVGACFNLLPTYPSFSFRLDCSINNAGQVVTDSFASASFMETWCNLCLNLSKTFGGVTDTRLTENTAFLMKLSGDMHTVPHWTLEQTQGSSPVETEYTSPGTHSFAPSDATLKAVKLTTTDPSP